LIQLSPQINVILSEKVDNKWTYIVGVYNDVYSTTLMNTTFRSYLCPLCIKFKEYISLGVYGFNKTKYQYNSDLLLKEYINLFNKNKIVVISYNTVYRTPLYTANTTIIGITNIVTIDTLASPVYDTMLIFNVNNLCKAEKLLRTTKPIGDYKLLYLIY